MSSKDIKPSSNQIPEKRNKTSQQYAAAIEKFKIVTDPVAVNPDELGADHLNRSGSIPNIQVSCCVWCVCVLFLFAVMFCVVSVLVPLPMLVLVSLWLLCWCLLLCCVCCLLLL